MMCSTGREGIMIHSTDGLVLLGGGEVVAGWGLVIPDGKEPSAPILPGQVLATPEGSSFPALGGRSFLPSRAGGSPA